MKKPHHRAPNLIGQAFGRLTVTAYAGSNGAKSAERMFDTPDSTNRCSTS